MALINHEAIPTAWATTRGWTRSYSPTSKRPFINPSDAESAPTMVDLIASENSANPIGLCGFITSNTNQIAIIDIDAPKSTKEYIKARVQHESLSADEIHQLVEQEVISTLPPAIKSLLTQTYAEYSASRCGVHIVFKLDKSKLPKRAYWKAKEFDGQLSVHHNYMVTTGDRIPTSSNELAEVPVSLISILFNIDLNKQRPNDVRENEELINSDVLPSPVEMENALMLVPLDQSPRIKEVYRQVTGEEYQHYDFWLKVGMALHDYAMKAKQMSNGLDMFIKWSVTDKEGFVSDEDVTNKWQSFRALPQNPITYKTIFKLSLSFQFNYPRRIRAKDGRALLNPEKTEYANFKYLMEKYHLELHHANGLELYLTGDRDIIEKYFMLQGVHDLFGYYGPYDTRLLEAATWKLCQDSLWRGLIGTHNFVQTWVAETKPEVDLFYQWLEHDDAAMADELKYPRYFRDLPRPVTTVPATFEFVESCIEWEEEQDVELCKQMLYKMFMQLIKLHEPQAAIFEDNGGMFALIGPENTYKTTFFKLLLPVPLEFLRHDVNQELNSEKNKRDFIRELSTRAIVLVDEFEGFMDQKKSGSFFKSIISGNVTSFTDIYQVKKQALRRKAIIVGTSNDARQVISDNGSRRLWFTRIKRINTSALLNLNLHKFYQNMRDEMLAQLAKGKVPWLMDAKDTKRVTQQNRAIKALSSADINLREAFPYTTNYKVTNKEDRLALIPRLSMHDIMPVDKDTNESRRYMKTQHVIKMLKFKQLEVPKTAELERALERYCMAFIGQEDPVIPLEKGYVIERGRLCFSKRPDGYWNHKYWILPTEEDYNVD